MAQAVGAKSDAEMSMAIDNLSAILGVDDVDKVIELLQQNNWDESAAAQAYYAQQAQQEMNQPRQRPAAAAGLNHSIQTSEDQYEREHGVRRPMEFQEDQLVGGPDDRVGLLGITPVQMMQMQQMQRMQQERMMGQTPNNARMPATRMLNQGMPARAPIMSYENLADATEDRAVGNANAEDQPGMARRFFRGMRAAFSSAFSWCNSDEDELQNVERASAEALQIFRAQFEENYRALTNGQPSRIESFTQSFPQLCVTSRRQKKPVLVLVTRTSHADCFREALTPMTQAEAALDMVREKFIFAGFCLDHPPLEQLGQIINLGHAQAALYFAVVQHDAKVQLLRKQNLSVSTSGQDLYNFVSETLNLFTIMAEEDPGYLQQEVLQNAGILPVGVEQAAQQRRASQNRPVSRQEDPDVQLRERQRREYEEAQLQDQIRRAEREEQEAKERAASEAQREQEELKEDEQELAKAIEFERKERAKWLIENMPEEPAEGTPDVAEVVLRAQGSGKRFTRRFLKTEKVGILYNYVRTLAGEDLGFDDENSQFQICQPFPRKTFEENADQTLEELGIYPRAALQIQELTDE